MAPPPVLFSHPSSLQHDTGGHPERAERIVAVMEELARRDWLGYERVESPPVERSVLERIHPASYVEAIERVSAEGGGFLDADTVVSTGSFEAALRGAGGAVALVERLLSGGPAAVGFSAHRPPGHHALASRAMGFCLFNNVAVAAAHALDASGLDRVMVLDWDVHHGNGTNDIFHASDRVLFCSIHQSPLYPGTGARSDVGEGPGRGFTVNLPVPGGSGDGVFVSLVRDVVVPVGREYRPQLILLSAGFDAHEGDPLAGCRVTEAGFAAMARLMRDLVAELDVPLGAVLEGGYALAPLARSVAVTMDVLRGGDGGADVAAAVEGLLDAGSDVPGCGVPDALALEARARLRPMWPILG
jgi:acetoin utilization deacetylase AcuC-like enzyme